ncbi:MAG TPA: ribonucleotide-diphosphate reductase subunit beta [Ktedonobacteraceae bacterium]|nr:ribonucleotide-diphosphate reductase subunit beta [Ktedonobacteraceae bacterium]
MSIEMPLEQAPLSQLQQTPIDNVLHIIDEGLVHLPTYRELYYRWERQQWKAQDIDFSADRQQWAAMSQDERSMRTYSLSAFFQGEACVTDTLAPYVLAMPDEEMRIFLTTQLVDEARHTVFFARFFHDVMGIETGKLEDSLAYARQYMNADLKYILIEALSEVADRIRREPGNLAHLVEGITLYHLVVEATMALAGQRNMLQIYRANNLFPAFRGGFTAVARDESRHVVFGVKFLRDMIHQDNAYAKVVHAAIDKYAPIAINAIAPDPEVAERVLAMGGDPWASPRYAIDSLTKKLKVVGIKIDTKLPEFPPPPVSV